MADQLTNKDVYI